MSTVTNHNPRIDLDRFMVTACSTFMSTVMIHGYPRWWSMRWSRARWHVREMCLEQLGTTDALFLFLDWNDTIKNNPVYSYVQKLHTKYKGFWEVLRCMLVVSCQHLRMGLRAEGVGPVAINISPVVSTWVFVGRMVQQLHNYMHARNISTI
jgi:hypothetical protein